jgi:hypothetical protein
VLEATGIGVAAAASPPPAELTCCGGIVSLRGSVGVTVVPGGGGGSGFVGLFGAGCGGLIRPEDVRSGAAAIGLGCCSTSGGGESSDNGDDSGGDIEPDGGDDDRSSLLVLPLSLDAELKRSLSSRLLLLGTTCCCCCVLGEGGTGGSGGSAAAYAAAMRAFVSSGDANGSVMRDGSAAACSRKLPLVPCGGAGDCVGDDDDDCAALAERCRDIVTRMWYGLYSCKLLRAISAGLTLNGTASSTSGGTI